MKSSILRTALVAKMEPVLTDDFAYLGQYAYALRVVAGTADNIGKARYADAQRARAYHLRTLAR